ncbi:MAG: hypothetical protein JSR66_17110 [Proteobacteria bacterium]|nr:hypothetical protein [Pseudomonadota bacterium]
MYPSEEHSNRAVIESASQSNESAVSAVSWAAILAGSVTAAASTIILVALGSGIGLASVSPWPGSGTSATAFTVMAAIWLIVVQWLSSCVGGYMTGRLRAKWVGTHTHEVFFRDTVHGFVTWAVGTLIGALLLLSAAAGVAKTGSETVAAAAGGAAHGAASTLPDAVSSYDVGRLLRPSAPGNDPSKADGRAEVAQILGKGITEGGVSQEDRDYLIKLIAARTGVSDSEARARVDQVIAAEKATALKAREAADAARKAAASAAIFTALSMLIGAFIASASAALGGRLRDLHP